MKGATTKSDFIVDTNEYSTSNTRVPSTFVGQYSSSTSTRRFGTLVEAGLPASGQRLLPQTSASIDDFDQDGTLYICVNKIKNMHREHLRDLPCYGNIQNE
jgi:hypothetical protein